MITTDNRRDPHTQVFRETEISAGSKTEPAIQTVSGAHPDRQDNLPDLSSMTFFSEKRSLFFISLLYFSDSLLIFSGKWITDSAGWIAVILSSLIAAPVIALFGRLVKNTGIAFPLLLLSRIAAAGLIAVSLYLFSDFLHRCVSMEVTGWLIPAFIFLTAAFAAFRDFNIIRRSASLLAAIAGVFLLLSVLFLWSRIDFSNIRHVFHGEQPFLSQCIFYSSVFAVKGILLKEILKLENETCMKKPAEARESKVIISALFLSSLLIAGIQLMTLTVLGDYLYSLIEYPVYYTLGMTKHGDYFERTEVISLAVFMITLTFQCSVLLRILAPVKNRQKRKKSLRFGNDAADSLSGER